jgi:hypothetical protein
MSAGVPAQAAGVEPLAVAGTVGLFALFLSVTAHVAARNVLGDVAVRKAFVVGPVPAAIAVVTVAFELPSIPGLGLAIVTDALVIGFVYEQGTRLTALITLIHFVVTVIAGTIVVGVLALFASAPV